MSNFSSLVDIANAIRLKVKGNKPQPIPEPVKPAIIQTARARINDADALVVHCDDAAQMSSFLMALGWDKLTWTKRRGDFCLAAPTGATLKVAVQGSSPTSPKFTTDPWEIAVSLMSDNVPAVGICNWRCMDYTGEARFITIHNQHILSDWLMFTDLSESFDGPLPGYFKLKYDGSKQSLFALSSPSWKTWDYFTEAIDDLLSKIEHEYE